MQSDGELPPIPDGLRVTHENPAADCGTGSCKREQTRYESGVARWVHERYTGDSVDLQVNDDPAETRSDRRGTFVTIARSGRHIGLILARPPVPSR